MGWISSRFGLFSYSLDVNDLILVETDIRTELGEMEVIWSEDGFIIPRSAHTHSNGDTIAVTAHSVHHNRPKRHN